MCIVQGDILYLVVSMNTWQPVLLRQAGTSKHWSSWGWCVHAKWGSGDIAPDINLNTGRRRAVSFTLRPFSPRRRSPSTHSGWVSLHSWSGHPGETEISSSGNQTMTLWLSSPLSTHYTNYATLTTHFRATYQNCPHYGGKYWYVLYLGNSNVKILIINATCQKV